MIYKKHILFALFIGTISISVNSQEINQIIQETGSPFVYLLDTNSAASEPLPSKILKNKAGWSLIPEEETQHTFHGDTVIVNNKIALVLRKNGNGTALHSLTEGGPVHRAALHPFNQGHDSWELAQIDIVENHLSAVQVHAVFQSGEMKNAIDFRITAGESILQIIPGDGTDNLFIASKPEYVIVSDFFSDDMVFSANTFSHPVRLPTEKILIHAIADGNALLMGVWESNRQTAIIHLSEDSDERKIAGTEIQCIQNQKIWLACLEHPNIWVDHNFANQPENWEPPFPAHWRVNFLQDTGFAFSETLSNIQAQEFDQEPYLVYPIERDRATPLTLYCPTDVMRNTLGVGPCQYILEAEGIGTGAAPTADKVTEWVERLFERNRDERSKDQIIERFDEMIKLLEQTQTRIEQYKIFAEQLLTIIKEKRDSLQDIAAEIDRLGLTVQTIQQVIDSKMNIQNPPQYAHERTQKIIALIGKEDVLSDCKKLCSEIRSAGAAQDYVLAKSRLLTRWLKQQCIMIRGRNPSAKEITQPVQEHIANILQENE